MGELIRSPEGMISLFHSEGLKDLPKPFEKEIFLQRTFIAGTSYIPGIAELAALMEPGERFGLLREPDNFVDEMAVRVISEKGVKLGYIPRIHNQIYARLMDAGKKLFAKAAAIDEREYGALITIDIFMQE